MEDTSKEKESTRLDSISHETLNELMEAAAESPWRQSFHVQPVTGYMNHPAGFVYHDGLYHLFYKWSPSGGREGISYWYHVTSKNLAAFRNEGVKVRPDTEHDSHGASSGSAFVIEQQVHLLYTGIHHTSEGQSTASRMHALMNDAFRVRKKTTPVRGDPPAGYTEGFKDPKVWEEDGFYHMTAGAQTTSDYGRALIYTSENLSGFKFKGEIITGLDQFGFIWEAPEFFTLDDQDILMFCPKGIDKYRYSYWNAYQSGYIMGRLNRETLTMEHGAFREFDNGFDFYAPRTTVGKDGERILIGWMGSEETDYPTASHKWSNCLTLPRVLTIENGKLKQRPVPSLETLRTDEITAVGYFNHFPRKMKDFYGDNYELIIDINENNASEVYINLRISRQEETRLVYNTETRLFTLDIEFSGALPENVDGMKRSVELEEDLHQLRIFMDYSSIEIFINDGEAVMTSRIFPSNRAVGVELSTEMGECYVNLTKYGLASFDYEKIIHNA